MLLLKVYLLIFLPVIAAIAMVYVNFYTKKRIRALNYDKKIREADLEAYQESEPLNPP